MKPTELLKTIYLGDRACCAICIDGWRKLVVLHVNQISRIRSKAGTWDFYTDEDIPNGCIVFGEVQAIQFSPAGPLPNDFINDVTVLETTDSITKKTVYIFTLSISSGDAAGKSTEIIVEIKAGDLYLQDPQIPESQIRE